MVSFKCFCDFDRSQSQRGRQPTISPHEICRSSVLVLWPSNQRDPSAICRCCFFFKVFLIWDPQRNPNAICRCSVLKCLLAPQCTAILCKDTAVFSTVLQCFCQSLCYISPLCIVNHQSVFSFVTLKVVPLRSVNVNHHSIAQNIPHRREHWTLNIENWTVNSEHCEQWTLWTVNTVNSELCEQ